MENENKKGRKKKEIGYNSVFAKKLRDLMEKYNTTQPQLAEAVGVSRQAVGQWQNGNTVPDILDFQKIAEYYNVSADYLLGRAENPSVKEDIQIACKVTGLSEKSIVILKSEAPKFEMQAMLTGETIEIPVGEWIINSIYPEMRLDLNRILLYLNFNLLLAKDSPISVDEYVYGAVSKISDKCKYKIDKYIQEQIGKMGYSDYKTITDMSREELFDFSKVGFSTSQQAFIISDKKKAGD